MWQITSYRFNRKRAVDLVEIILGAMASWIVGKLLDKAFTKNALRYLVYFRSRWVNFGPLISGLAGRLANLPMPTCYWRKDGFYFLWRTPSPHYLSRFRIGLLTSSTILTSAVALGVTRPEVSATSWYLPVLLALTVVCLGGAVMFKHRVFGYDTGDEMLKDLGPDESDWVITVQAQSSEAPISSLTSVNPWDRDDREQDIP